MRIVHVVVVPLAGPVSLRLPKHHNVSIFTIANTNVWLHQTALVHMFGCVCGTRLVVAKQGEVCTFVAASHTHASQPTSDKSHTRRQERSRAMSRERSRARLREIGVKRSEGAERSRVRTIQVKQHMTSVAVIPGNGAVPPQDAPKIGKVALRHELRPVLRFVTTLPVQPGNHHP